MQLVPLLLELVRGDDIEAILKREPAEQRLPRRCPRLCRQAPKQAGLLSNCGLAVWLGSQDSRIAGLLANLAGQLREEP